MLADGGSAGPSRLDGHEVRARLSIKQARQAMVGALGDLGAGTLVAPLRQAVASPAGTTLLMPAWSKRSLAVKILHIRPKNRRRRLPTINGELLLSDLETGRLLAVIDAPVLTALRTAGLTGAASRLLAPVRTQVAALIGAGFQAPFQARAMVEACPAIGCLRLFNRTAGRAHALARLLEAEMPGVKLEVASTIEAAVDGAQLVTTVTGAESALIDRGMLGEECHLNAIGAYTPTMAELAPEVLAGAGAVYVDTLEGCLAEAGDLIQAAATGRWHWSAAAPLAGPLPPRRGITIFKSVGSAAFDLAAAEALLGLA